MQWVWHHRKYQKKMNDHLLFSLTQSPRLGVGNENFFIDFSIWTCIHNGKSKFKTNLLRKSTNTILEKVGLTNLNNTTYGLNLFILVINFRVRRATWTFFIIKLSQECSYNDFQQKIPSEQKHMIPNIIILWVITRKRPQPSNFKQINWFLYWLYSNYNAFSTFIEAGIKINRW